MANKLDQVRQHSLDQGCIVYGFKNSRVTREAELNFKCVGNINATSIDVPVTNGVWRAVNNFQSCNLKNAVGLRICACSFNIEYNIVLTSTGQIPYKWL